MPDSICKAPFCDNTISSPKTHAYCGIHRWEREKYKVKPFKQIQLFNPKYKKKIKLTSEQNKINNQKYSDYRRNYKYQKRYGVSYEKYQELLIIYDNKCAICKLPPDSKHPLHLDHCHQTNKIRGILCYKCNVALGYFQDSITNLSNAVNYLRHHF